MAHLIREIRFLAEHRVRKLSRWGNDLLEWLKKLFSTLHRREHLTEPGFRRSMERIKDGFLNAMRRRPDHNLARTLARRFKGKAAEDYFRFLTEPNMEPTNNGTSDRFAPSSWTGGLRREPAAMPGCAGANASGLSWRPAKNRTEMSLSLS
jgi:hypothetical protein